MIVQTPWVERKFEFNFPVGLYPIIIQRLQSTNPALRSLVEKIPDEKLSTRPEGKWSAKEVVGHLYDVEDLWNGRVDDFLSHADTLRAADMTNAKTTNARHNEQGIAELLEKFATARNKLIARVGNFDEQTASLVSLHPRLKTPMRLIDSLFFIVEHVDHELTKISQLIRS